MSFIFFSSVADEEKEEGGKEVGEKEREGEKRRAWDGDGGVNVLVEGKGLNGLTGTTKMTITVRRYRGDIRGDIRKKTRQGFYAEEGRNRKF